MQEKMYQFKEPDKTYRLALVVTHLFSSTSQNSEKPAISNYTQLLDTTANTLKLNVSALGNPPVANGNPSVWSGLSPVAPTESNTPINNGNPSVTNAQVAPTESNTPINQQQCADNNGAPIMNTASSNLIIILLDGVLESLQKGDISKASEHLTLAKQQLSTSTTSNSSIMHRSHANISGPPTQETPANSTRIFASK